MQRSLIQRTRLGNELIEQRSLFRLHLLPANEASHVGLNPDGSVVLASNLRSFQALVSGLFDQRCPVGGLRGSAEALRRRSSVLAVEEHDGVMQPRGLFLLQC